MLDRFTSWTILILFGLSMFMLIAFFMRHPERATCGVRGQEFPCSYGGKR